MLWSCAEFLSTLSLRRATHRPHPNTQHPAISIHALLAESDARRSWARPNCCYFYPRSPCGERLITASVPASPAIISIHALLAESDAPKGADGLLTGISIHALLAESDIYRQWRCWVCGAFLSTLSLRRATSSSLVIKLPLRSISIHALLAESDQAANAR